MLLVVFGNFFDLVEVGFVDGRSEMVDEFKVCGEIVGYRVVIIISWIVGYGYCVDC